MQRSWLSFVPGQILQRTCSYDLSRVNNTCSGSANVSHSSIYTLCQTEACVFTRPHRSRIATERVIAPSSMFVVPYRSLLVKWLPVLPTTQSRSTGCPRYNPTLEPVHALTLTNILSHKPLTTPRWIPPQHPSVAKIDDGSYSHYQIS